jgi:signal transduction histidine kinase
VGSLGAGLLVLVPLFILGKILLIVVLFGAFGGFFWRNYEVGTPRRPSARRWRPRRSEEPKEKSRTEQFEEWHRLAHAREEVDTWIEDHDGNLPEVNVDPVRIREVVTNLVVNALRSMPDGGTLLLATEGKADEATIEVGDTGTGIDEDNLRHVFDRFQKGTESPGSGLGLTISRDLVEAHGGTIDISSERGVGTVVRVVLPLGPTPG